MHLQENTFFDVGVKVAYNVAQYPLHYVACAPAKFEVATSNGLGDVFTKKQQHHFTNDLGVKVT